jgi:hypothetical protein
MIHDLVLVACGFVFAYALDVWLYLRFMRKDYMPPAARQVEEL